MDAQELINYLAAVVGTLFGWVIHGIKTDIAEQKKESNDLADKVHAIDKLVAGDYVRKDDLYPKLNHLEAKIERGFEKVFEKLDGKQDKVR